MYRVFQKKFFVLIGVIGLVLVLLDYLGVIWHNVPFASMYKVQGLDISHHQGKIEWQKVAQTGQYAFVYIKATEGHDFRDKEFLSNWQQAQAQGLLVGAYHFFSTRSSGEEQAKYYISTVPKVAGALPPAVDVEVDLAQSPDQVRTELRTMLRTLQLYYQQKPILYVTYNTYHVYIEGYFAENTIWIRDVLKPPTLGQQPWQFWQFNNRGRVPGINMYVDLNVFRGSLKQLKELTVKMPN